MNFIPLDYSSPPKDDGLYWVAGTRPACEPDDDGDGVVRTGYTGKAEQFVALVWLSVTAGGVVFHAVDRHTIGTVHEDDSVTHYAPFQIPAHPEAISP